MHWACSSSGFPRNIKALWLKVGQMNSGKAKPTAAHSVILDFSKVLLLLSHFSCVRLCVTPWMAAHQAPLSLGYSRQEYWSGLPFPSPMHACMLSRFIVSDSVRPFGQQPTRLHCPQDSLGKNTGVGCHFLLQSKVQGRVTPYHITLFSFFKTYM